MRKFHQYKKRAVLLRSLGFTYSEINKKLHTSISKSTLSLWLQKVELTSSGKKRLSKKIAETLQKVRNVSALLKKEKRLMKIQKLEEKNSNLTVVLQDHQVRKALLGILYQAEGTKRRSGAVTFGNADPAMISLFLFLLRETFSIDEQKFRCTLQARNDQNIAALEGFWSRITGIPRNQFYGARIDPRSKGKKTLKSDYKGVCRIDYLSSDMLYELMSIGKILTRACSSAG